MLTFLSVLFLQVTAVGAADVQARIDRDVSEARPVVAHVVVALCDNTNQGIVPVSKALGDGQNPRSNLYWGAAYGVRTYFSRLDRYSLTEADWETGPRVLDKAVFSTEVVRAGESVPLFVVAEAWGGQHMKGAISRFLRMASGHDPSNVRLAGSAKPILAGGSSAIVAFVGHNGLMDFRAPPVPGPNPESPPRASIVLACASKPYFLNMLRRGGSYPLMLTNGLMAPEAYSLEAALVSFVAGKAPREVLEATASAYDRFQHCGTRGARGLFSVEE